MTDYEIPPELSRFLKMEIYKEFQKQKSLEIPLSYSVERIFKLVAHVASFAKPVIRKKMISEGTE